MLGVKTRYLEKGYLLSSSFPTRPAAFTKNYSTDITYNGKHMQITIIMPASIAYNQEGASSVPPDSFNRV